MTVSERILLALSRTPDGQVLDLYEGTDAQNALDILHDSFGDSFSSAVRGQRVLDYGSGYGYQSVAMAKLGANVVGIDLVEDWLQMARQHALEEGVADRVSFHNMTGKDPVTALGRESFDVIISQNSFEHFRDPAAVLRTWSDLIKPSGTVFLVFAPVWLHPYGAHMYYFTWVPWVHLLFPEKTVLQVRDRFHFDNAHRYEDIDMGLNRMTIRRFKRLIAQSAFDMEYFKLMPFKRLTILTKLPLLNEFLTSGIKCILTPREVP